MVAVIWFDGLCWVSATGYGWRFVDDWYFFYGLSKLEVVISLVTTVLVIPIFMVVAERIVDHGSCQCNLIILGIPSF